MTTCLNNCQCCNGSICPNSAMPGKQSKEIRVYGTLKNWTLDPQRSNGTTADEDYHNDALAYAYQLYDNRFFSDKDTIENYQDVINKRLTAISYADGVTTIENRDKSKGNPYMLIVNGHTNIGGDLHVAGDLYYIDENGDERKLDLSDLMRRLAALEQLWYYDTNTKMVTTVGEKPAAAYGFYDTDPKMSA